MTRRLIEQMREALQNAVDGMGGSYLIWAPKAQAAITAAREYLAQPEQSYGWLIACDEEMICTHLGVANLSDSYDSAKAKLKSLVDWHIAVATDPAVNGGPSLQPEQSEPTYWSNPSGRLYATKLEAMQAGAGHAEGVCFKLFTEAPPLREPEQSEPVAYRAWFDGHNVARWLFTLWPEEEQLNVDWQPLYTAPPLREPEQSEPVGVVREHEAHWPSGGMIQYADWANDTAPPVGTKLYTAPLRELGEPEIEDIFESSAGYGRDDFINFAKAILAAARS